MARIRKMSLYGYREGKNINNPSVMHQKKAEWRWDAAQATTNIKLSNDSLDVLFHPLSSDGTGAVRGDKPFTLGHVYYWEIEVKSYRIGTDTIIGVGTNDFDLKGFQNEYTSLIGSDKKSWGYTFMGVKHHDGIKTGYGPRYNDTVTLIGVRLDMFRGTLEFFHNRRPLGVAFENLNKEHLLYPMVCSTSCQTEFKIKYCHSVPVDLQLLCLEVLGTSNDSLIPPGLLKIVKDYWWIPRLTRLNPYAKRQFSAS